ncbi:hypothetical protein D3C87_1385870 [compost metagenome]
MLARGGLLDQVDAGRLQHGDAGGRVGLVPRLIHVDGHAGAVAQRALDGGDVRHVVTHRAAADLELERVVAALGQQALGFLDVAGGVAAGQGPEHRQRVAHGTPEQRGQRHVQALALPVEQRGFQRALGEAVAARHLVQPRHRAVDVGGVLADQRRAQVGVDGQLDAFGAFFPIGQPANGSGLADALHAVAAAQPHDHQRLLLHGRHGQLVGPDGREIDQDGLDAGNRRSHTFSMLGISCNRAYALTLLASKTDDVSIDTLWVCIDPTKEAPWNSGTCAISRPSRRNSM